MGAGRTGIVVRNAAGAAVFKGAAFFITLATMPLYVEFFESRSLLGVWLAAISIVNWILTLDFGIGNGLRNDAVRLLAGQLPRAELRRRISGAYAAATLLAFVLFAASMVLVLFLDWGALLGVRPGVWFGGEGIRWVLGGLVATVATQSVLRLSSSLLYAIQKSAVVNGIALATSGALLVYVALAPPVVDLGGVVRLCTAYFLAVNAPLVFASIWLFRGPLRGFAPRSWREASKGASSALRAGGTFFANQVLYTALLGTSTVLVANLAGSSSAFEYQSHYLIFSIAGTLVLLGLTPLWSAITKAEAEGDFEWIEEALRRTEVVGWSLVALGVVLVPFVQVILDRWLGGGVVVSSSARAGAFAAYGGGFVLHGIVATFASGLGRLRVQFWAYSVGLIFKVAVAVVGVRFTGDWAFVPVADGIVLLTYYSVERGALKKWLTNR